MRHTPYLLKSRHHVYYFRITCPQLPTNAQTRREFRRSLRTRDPQLARRRMHALLHHFELHLDALRKGMMDWKTLKEILDIELKRFLEAEQARIATEGPSSTLQRDIWLENKVPTLEKAIEAHSYQYPPPPIPAYCQRGIDSIFNRHNIKLDKDSKLYAAFVRTYLETQIQAFKQAWALNVAAGEVSPSEPPITPALQQHNDTEAFSQATETKLLTDIIEIFCNERVQGKNWNEKTEASQRHSLNLLLEVLGQDSVCDVSKSNARRYKDVLQKIPKNMRKKPQYRNQTIEALCNANLPQSERLSTSKINDHIDTASSLFKWAVDNGYTGINPFHGLKIKTTKKPNEQRLPFDDSDLIKLFSAPEFQTKKRKHPHYYWLPLIGLYTGARIEEICQLHLEDIRQVDGVWVFDINDIAEKRLKTTSSARLIPIHTKLLDAGLIRYVKVLRGKNESRLFPELTKQRDGYSQAASKWFGRLKNRHGVLHKDKVFHSFRHTFSNSLKQQGIPKEMIAALMGHKDESVTTGVYGSDYIPAVLAPLILKLEFPIDIPAYDGLKKATVHSEGSTI